MPGNVLTGPLHGLMVQARVVRALGGFPDALKKAQELGGIPVDARGPLMILRGDGDPLAPEPFEAAQLLRTLSELPAAICDKPLALMPFTSD